MLRAFGRAGRLWRRIDALSRILNNVYLVSKLYVLMRLEILRRNKIRDFLSERKFGLTMACAVVMSALFAIYMTPLRLLWPMGPDDMPAWMDGIQNAVGQRYYFRDHFRWPLLDTRLITPPEGLSIAMVDATPIITLPAKVLYPFLPVWFTTIGLWFAVSFFLQPLSAIVALIASGERRSSALLVGGVIAACMPFFLARAIHVTLMGQFVILFSIALYFYFFTNPIRAFWYSVALLVVTLLVHPYLLAMAAAVILATSLSMLGRRSSFWWAPLASVGVSATICAFLAWSLGYFRSQSDAGGYGVFSLNLLAPIWPMHSTLMEWIPPLTYARPEQSFEGYAWLGAGLWALLLVAAVLRPTRLVWRRHTGVPVLAVTLILFAASTEGWVGGFKVWATDAHIPFSGMFRASGRFFWPVGYFLLIFGVRATRFLSPPIAVLLLSAAVSLQITDTHDLRREARSLLRATPDEGASTRALRLLMEKKKKLSIYPLYECGLDLWGDHQSAIVNLFRLASERRLTLNTFYTSRPSNALDCSIKPEKVQSEDSLEVYEIEKASPPSNRNCSTIDSLSVCFVR